MTSNPLSLLPVESSPLELAIAEVCSELAALPVPLRDLWNPDTCPLDLLPYLAWAFSVDRWSWDWSEQTKRNVVKSAYFIHRHKGTIGALYRAVEPLGFLIKITEWWQAGDKPGTFRLEVGVLESGITDEMYREVERLINDAKPCSRHLIGLTISITVNVSLRMGIASQGGDVLTVYAYSPGTITTNQTQYYACGLHITDTVSVKI